jgi:hypothetical protein
MPSSQQWMKMGTTNDLYADVTLPDISLLAVVDIGPYTDANPPAAFLPIVVDE